VTDFTLPELGENITAGDVLRVLVKPGDTLAKEQPVLELETDKATIEVPSSVAGHVKEVKVKAGEKVQVGQSILTVDDNEAAASKAAPAAAGESANQRAVAANTPSKDPAEGGLEQHVQGRARQTPPDKQGVKPERPTDRDDPAPADRFRGSGPDSDKVVDITRGARTASEPDHDAPAAPAAPSVRLLARELGVDINEVAGSEPGGRISTDDVKMHAKRIVTAPGTAVRGNAEPLPDFSRWGEIERQPMRAVRRKTAEHVGVAWTTIPHVTQHDAADITALEELRQRYAKTAEAAGGALTITAIAMKVAASALKLFPRFNSSIDMAAGEIIFKKYVNIGIAVDTDRGLLVPVVRDADAKNIVQLSVEVSELAEKARNRKITLDEMQGGTFSISNLGGIGGTSFTPIVNAPEVAILGLSRARVEPVWRDGAVAPRLMLPLSLSYDHRVIDGADGARFLRWVAEAFEQPFLLALQGS
jgi:pyruvate dehydrogenase E2 component (dihydrolipoamide acetyltransferase)